MQRRNDTSSMLLTGRSVASEKESVFLWSIFFVTLMSFLRRILADQRELESKYKQVQEQINACKARWVAARRELEQLQVPKSYC